jgi:hypothetical protein
VNKEDFQLGDLVLKWDAPKQDKGKHGKFEALWIGLFKIFQVFSNNTFKLQNMENEEVFGVITLNCLGSFSLFLSFFKP